TCRLNTRRRRIPVVVGVIDKYKAFISRKGGLVRSATVSGTNPRSSRTEYQARLNGGRRISSHCHQLTIGRRKGGGVPGIAQQLAGFGIAKAQGLAFNGNTVGPALHRCAEAKA